MSCRGAACWGMRWSGGGAHSYANSLRPVCVYRNIRTMIRTRAPTWPGAVHTRHSNICNSVCLAARRRSAEREIERLMREVATVVVVWHACRRACFDEEEMIASAT